MLHQTNQKTSSRSLAILGSTGSIGTQTLEVLSELGNFELAGIAAGGNAELLSKQISQHKPRFAALSSEKAAADVVPGDQTELISGENAMISLLEKSRPDVVVTAVVGSAGLLPTLKAIELGADLALANKETLVCAGEIVMPAASKAGIEILPVDSEHSGIFQCLKAGTHKEIRKVTITSSGGALRDWSDEDAQTATAVDALNHPTWSMGQKITIDSATLINKVLEVIEAHWLFDLDESQIDVVIHPQSIVHAIVEFCDGTVIAQLAEPDMKLPIAYALGYPQRPNRDVPLLDLAKIGSLDFKPVEGRNLRALELAWRVIREGKQTGAVLNAANEVAVEAFLAGKIKFGDIIPAIEKSLDIWETEKSSVIFSSDLADNIVQLENILKADTWTRKLVSKMLEL